MTDITDLRLRRAFLDAAEKDFQEALSTASDVPSFSARYLRWEDRFLDHPVETARRAFRTGWQKALRMAACIALIAALSFAMLMATSAQAREWVLRWLMEWHPTHVSFIATESAESDNTKYWEPSWLPEGYSRTEFDADGGFVIAVYESSSNEPPIYLQYMTIQEDMGFHIDNEWHTITNTEINNMPGKRFDSTRGETNMVLWFSEENQYSFLLTSNLSSDTLMTVAESLYLVDESPNK